ncbi:hypothetical protein GH714_000620 [Hevea brasiliensis]|uniref:40S ribosomal protein S14 n=1 Tax=Hevea brasiliensis TaxID=3981 RepID=A0A6A6NAL8_HEVBR|nr:hypothetical protein GH714_000620 [Hevea brasiliensis]
MVVGVGFMLRKCRQDAERFWLGKGFMAMGMELVVAQRGVGGGRTIVRVGVMVVVGSFGKVASGEYIVLVELVFFAFVGGGPGVLSRCTGVGAEESLQHVTDLSGRETMVRVTAQDVSQRCKELVITALHIKLRAKGGNKSKTPGPGAQSALWALARSGMKIGCIEDVTTIPTDSTRRKGGRRGRRL